MNDYRKIIEERIKNGREYRNLATPLESKSDDYIVEGYATTFNQPYLIWEEDGFEIWEQVDRNAFSKTDMSDVIMQYDHRGRVFARNKNGTLNLNTDDFGLHIRADLGGTDIGKELHQEIKGGYTDKMSFAFTVRGDEILEENKDNKTIITRTITDIGKLYDVSAVSIPANDATSISARSYGDGLIAEVKAERQRVEQEQRRRKSLKLKIELMEV